MIFEMSGVHSGERTLLAMVAKKCRDLFEDELLESGHNIRVVQELMGHKDVQTTMIYTHVMNNSLAAVRSPADVLPG